MNKSFLVGALVLAVTGTFVARMEQRGALPVGEGARGTELGQLEATVAKHPDDAEAVAKLMRAYIERGESGNAVAVAQRSPVASLSTPASIDLVARANLGAGRATESLVLTVRVLKACETSPCDASLVGRAARRERLLDAMVAMGIEDLDKNPEAATAAYQRTARNVSMSAN